MSDLTLLTNTLTTLVITYSTVSLDNDYRKTSIQLGTTIQFIFNNRGEFVEYKKLP